MMGVIFGIGITVLTYKIGVFIYKHTGLVFLNPILISIALIIVVMRSLNISLEFYNQGGKWINLLLFPATVVLAVPLYEQLDLFRKHAVPILAGITVGSLSGMAGIIFLADLLGLSKLLTTSLLPKSITTPIGIEVAKQIGGNPQITVMSIVITGILGAVIGPLVCDTAKIKDPVAVGTAMGTAAHAVGTSKALELGIVQGAMSSLSIGIAGLLTVFLAPLLVHFFLA